MSDSIQQRCSISASTAPPPLFGLCACALWFKKHQNAIDADLLPGWAEGRAGPNRRAQPRLPSPKAGWQAIGFDHYAHPGDAMGASRPDCFFIQIKLAELLRRKLS